MTVWLAVIGFLLLARRLLFRIPVRLAALVVTACLVGGTMLTGAPQAQAQVFDCKEAPNPDRPGSGLVGVLDPTPAGPDGMAVQGTEGSAYATYGYAGQVWHTYDLGCGPGGLRNPNAIIDTWAGNQLFNVGKTIVSATNGLHYILLDGNLLRPLDSLIERATDALYNSVFAPLFGLLAVILAVLLFGAIFRGDLAKVGSRSLWALAGLWLASATYLTPLLYTSILDGVLVTGTNAVQTGFLNEVGIEQRDELPTLLERQVIYRNWLRGEFGSADSPQARDLGRPLLDAQAWSIEQVADGADGGSAEEKKDAFTDLSEQMGSAYGYFQGKDGSRVGIGFLSVLEAFAFSIFPLLAKLTVLLGQVLLRILVLLGPLIGLIAILHHQVLRGVGRAVGTVLLNVLVVAAMAGLHTLVLTWLFDPARGLPLLTQVLLGLLVTVVMLMLARPLKRMWQMIEVSVLPTSAAMSGASQAGGAGGRLSSMGGAMLGGALARRGGTETDPAQRAASGVTPDAENRNTTRPEAAGAGGMVRRPSTRMDSAQQAGQAAVGAARAGPLAAGAAAAVSWHGSRRQQRELPRASEGEPTAGNGVPGRELPPARARGEVAGSPAAGGSRERQNASAAQLAGQQRGTSSAGHATNGGAAERFAGTTGGAPWASGQPPSRTADTNPITDRGWDSEPNDDVVVPSHLHGRRMRRARPAELEHVNGKQVWVVYRPSSGLETHDRAGRGG